MLGVGRLAHVGEDQVLQADLLDGPCRVEDRALTADEEACSGVGVAGLDDLLVRRKAWSGRGVAPMSR